MHAYMSGGTIERWKIALRRKLRSNPESAAEAIMLHSLECTTTQGIRLGLGGTRHHKGCAHIQVDELVCAAQLCLTRSGLHWGYNQKQKQNCSLWTVTHQGFHNRHGWFFLSMVNFLAQFCLLIVCSFGIFILFYRWIWRLTVIHCMSYLNNF